MKISGWSRIGTAKAATLVGEIHDGRKNIIVWVHLGAW